MGPKPSVCPWAVDPAARKVIEETSTGVRRATWASDLLLHVGVKVRLTRKLADVIDGVDLSNHEVGDLIDLPDRKARLLLGEEWAISERRGTGGPFRLAFRRDTDLGHYQSTERDLTRAS